MTTATIHHHFPAKEDLGRVLMQRYRERFAGALAVVERTKTLRAFASAANRARQHRPANICGNCAMPERQRFSSISPTRLPSGSRTNPIHNS